MGAGYIQSLAIDCCWLTTSSVDESKFSKKSSMLSCTKETNILARSGNIRPPGCADGGRESKVKRDNSGKFVMEHLFFWLRWVPCWCSIHQIMHKWPPEIYSMPMSSFQCWLWKVQQASARMPHVEEKWSKQHLPVHNINCSTASQWEWNPHDELKMYQLNIDTTNDALEEVYPS